MALAIHQYDQSQAYVYPSLKPPPSSSPHPSRLSQSIGTVCPASYCQIPTIIYFTWWSVHFPHTCKENFRVLDSVGEGRDRMIWKIPFIFIIVPFSTAVAPVQETRFRATQASSRSRRLGNQCWKHPWVTGECPLHNQDLEAEINLGWLWLFCSSINICNFKRDIL